MVTRDQGPEGPPAHAIPGPWPPAPAALASRHLQTGRGARTAPPDALWGTAWKPLARGWSAGPSLASRQEIPGGGWKEGPWGRGVPHFPRRRHGCGRLGRPRALCLRKGSRPSALPHVGASPARHTAPRETSSRSVTGSWGARAKGPTQFPVLETRPNVGAPTWGPAVQGGGAPWGTRLAPGPGGRGSTRLGSPHRCRASSPHRAREGPRAPRETR